MVKKFREIYMHTHTKFLCMHINFLKQKFHIYIGTNESGDNKTH